MATEINRIPKLMETTEGDVLVAHWGQAAGTLFRGGDRLIIDEHSQEGLLVFRPKGWGNPMFGRRDGMQLLAVPSGAPASTIRWHVAGSVKSVERGLERGSLGTGRWYCAVRIETSDLAAMAKAKMKFEGGWKTASELDAMCRAAAVAPETHGVAIAIAAADGAAAADKMVSTVPVGRLRFEIRPVMEEEVRNGVLIPGPWSQIRSSARHWTDQPYERTRVAGQRRLVAGGGTRVQLSLFGDTALVDG